MARYIDADALIETMKKVEKGYEDAMTRPSWWTSYSVISEQPTAYDKDGWINVSERLPESGVSVIVSYKDRFLSQADGTCGGWYDVANMIWHLTDYEYSDNVEVIAWQPLPEPYKE